MCLCIIISWINDGDSEVQKDYQYITLLTLNSTYYSKVSIFPFSLVRLIFLTTLLSMFTLKPVLGYSFDQKGLLERTPSTEHHGCLRPSFLILFQWLPVKSSE